MNNMKETTEKTVYNDNDAKAESSERVHDEKRSQIKLKRGMSGIVAAALIAALGGGAAFIAAKNSGGVSPGAAVSQTADSITSQSDANAELVFKVVANNLSEKIADGYAADIKPGTYITGLEAVPEDTAYLLREHTELESPAIFEDGSVEKLPYSDIELPDEGNVFFCIDEKLEVVFAQWQSPDESALGQYPAELERAEFGKLPESITKKQEEEAQKLRENMEAAPNAYKLYQLVNGIVADTDYYPAVRGMLLPPGSGAVISLDQPAPELDSNASAMYPDFVYRLSQAAGGDGALTGKIYFQYSFGNEAYFLQWTDGSRTEIWPALPEGEECEFGKAPKQYSGYSFDDPAQINEWSQEIDCSKFDRSEGAYGTYHGAVTRRENIPGVIEWYKDFIQRGYIPVDFDAGKLIDEKDIDKAVSFEWYDAEQKRFIYIRTSDMEGANIYVNGCYYNAEDISVLSLLDDGMPAPDNTF